ncbi:MAG TPA: MATE family efflux transporter [Mycobacteriales bacterium]|nr:MATE family efflux transporter [Mycobacteriales bacterium]
MRLLRLSAAAFVVLAAEPSFVLIDTAVVGHLGAVPLGALGIGGTLLSLVAMIGAFLDYGTTGRAARWFGAGQRDRAVDEGVTASVLALALGVMAIGAGELFAGPLIRLLAGGPNAVSAAAEAWFRVAVLGVPGILLVLAGNGWMRGVQDTRRPVRIVVLANVLSAAASPILVYPLGLGLRGSAIANVGAQVVAGVLFVRAVRAERRPWKPRWSVLRGQLTAGRDLLLREAGFQAAFLTAAAVAARMGTAQLAAHQIGLQLWVFTALLLDSFAIAAQSLVGAALGGGDAREARRTAWQVARYGLIAGIVFSALLGAGWWLIPAAFTSSSSVQHQAHLLWPFFIALQPAAGVVFALDGVLIGAGDVGFLRTVTLISGVGIFVPITIAALHWHWGIGGVWAGLTAFIVARLIGMLVRTARGRWAVIGVAT